MNSVSVTNGYIVETAMPASASSARATAESLLNPALEAPYAAEPGNAEKVISGTDVDDAAGTLLPHLGEHCLHGDQRRDEVELEDGAEVVGIDLVQRCVQPLTGDIAQDVDPPERLRGGTHGRVDLARIGDVTADRHRLAQFAGESANAILPAREKYHLCAGPRSGTRRRRSDSDDAPVTSTTALPISIKPVSSEIPGFWRGERASAATREITYQTIAIK
jgi:hypothetical protein